MKKEICLLVSGLPRFFNVTLELLKNQISDNSINLSIYAHFWKPMTDSQIVQWNHYFPNTKIWLSEPVEFKNNDIKRVAEETNVANTLSMLFGRKVFADYLQKDSIFNNSNYDLVIHTRSDICLTDKIDYLKACDTVSENALVMVPMNGNWRGGINDQLVITNKKTIYKYLSVFDDNFIATFNHRNPINYRLFHPETILKEHLMKNKILIHKMNNQSILFRAPYKFQLG